MQTCCYNLAGKKITQHDCQIIALVIKGYPRKIICDQLKITENTLDTEMRILYAKLQIHDKLELYKLATRNGFTDEGSYINLPHWQQNETKPSIINTKTKRKKPRTKKLNDRPNQLF
jgi:DNA-binding CsgD family transcriptional regulator